MSEEPKSILKSIEDLARITEAPQAFVEQVRTLFRSKGISLEDDAAPYHGALVEAFRREHAIRKSTLQAKDDLVRLRQRRTPVRESDRGSVSGSAGASRRAPRSSTELDTYALRLARKAQGARSEESSGTRRWLTRGDRDDVPMVPGPKDLQ